MKANPKVLVYIPLAPRTPKIYTRTLSSVLSMYWSGPLTVTMDREDADTLRELPEAYANITSKYNRAREMALSGGYDALLTVEADMILPPMALERLSALDTDVAYGLYCSRHGHHQWLGYTYLDGESGTSLSFDEINAREAWGKAVETKGVGMGCTLIWRHVLEALPFRCPKPDFANDWYFAMDCQERGFKQMTDCGVVCGHIAPDPLRIYWPDPDAFGLFREEFLTPPAPVRQLEVIVGGAGVQKVYAMKEGA